MPDIFLSYNREDQARAKLFAEAFEREGLKVWWDTTLRAGEAYDEVTETALREAKVVVVLWSKKSVASRWVRAEASIGQELKRLAPAKIEACDLPVMFRLVQTAELAHWRGDSDDTAWAAFLSDVGRFVAQDLPASPPPGPAPRKAATARLSVRNPVVIGGTLFALLAAIVAAVVMMRPPTTAASGELAPLRTAFFGFSADANDAVATDMAKSATRETYAALGANALETASESKTRNIERSAQLDRAKELGASYALGGEVLRSGDHFNVAIWLEDVEARTSLLQATLTGDESQKVSLPFQAAAHATSGLQCYIEDRIGLRTLLSPETDEMTRAVARFCSTRQHDALRELARLAPGSPGVQAVLALYLFLAIGGVPATDHPAMRQEIDAAVKAALAADPKNAIARVIQAELLIADGKSLAEAEKLFLEARRSDRDFYFLNIRYGMFLRSVGRYREALPFLEASVRQRPFAAGNRATLAHTQATTSLPIDAEKNYRYSDTRLPDDGTNWNAWIQSALFDGIGDPREILQRPPPRVSGDAVACTKDMVEGILSHNAKQHAIAGDRLIDCAKGSLPPHLAVGPAATLGKTKEAFSLAREGIVRENYTFATASALFATGSRPMRADKDFLQLVTELGIYQYWVDTKTQPDVCETPEEREFDICRKLRKDQPPR